MLLESLLPLLAASLAPAAAGQELPIYSTDFTTLDGWTVIVGCNEPNYRWRADANPAWHPAGAFRSAPHSLNFNNGASIGFPGVGGPRTCGKVRSDAIDLSLASGTPLLRFHASWLCEIDCGWDVLSVEVRPAGGGAALYSDPCLNPIPGDQSWRVFNIPLDSAWGAVEIEFEFDTIDGWFNEGTGAFIDALEVLDVVDALFCIGDGSEGPCPCGNESAPGESAGCVNSVGTGGQLRVEGQASLSADTLELLGSGMPDQPVVYFQAAASHPAVPFGDGLRCTGGPYVRLGVATNTAGASSYPGPGEPSNSVRAMIDGPGTRYYQARYRDPSTSCTAAGFNLTNALEVVWQP